MYTQVSGASFATKEASDLGTEARGEGMPLRSVLLP